MKLTPISFNLARVATLGLGKEADAVGAVEAGAEVPREGVASAGAL